MSISPEAVKYAGEHGPYFEWLLGLVGGLDWYAGVERQLARALERRFSWLHPIDENVALYGQNLRLEYVKDNWRGQVSVLSGECSVLEVLVHLALRVEDELMRSPTPTTERTAHLYFGKIVDTIGLGSCDVEDTDSVIDEFLTVGFHGYGFYQNGRRRTLWEQINAMFSEDVWLAAEEDL